VGFGFAYGRGVFFVGAVSDRENGVIRARRALLVWIDLSIGAGCFSALSGGGQRREHQADASLGGGTKTTTVI
jgi:hypothetical protein